jgi:hypothetical protein
VADRPVTSSNSRQTRAQVIAAIDRAVADWIVITLQRCKKDTGFYSEMKPGFSKMLTSYQK